MRMSCNGCRVLRKGCSDNCSIRPCLQWIKNPESQSNATVFLAKFYGRAGLMNLINAGPEQLRPAIFRSLLYEACGRIVNPIFGSVGLLWSGSWHLCQEAVEAVLKGAPVVQISSQDAAAAAASTPVPPMKAYDIRHVYKDPDADAAAASRAAAGLLKISKGRIRFKRAAAAKPKPGTVPVEMPEPDPAWVSNLSCPLDFLRAPSHGSAASQATDPAAGREEGDSRETESVLSGETGEASHVSQGEPNQALAEEGEVELELELTLGFGPVAGSGRTALPAPEAPCDECSGGPA